ncbi:MAG: hypothetical protein AB1421_08400 [Pseudomonadota bacterium]
MHIPPRRRNPRLAALLAAAMATAFSAQASAGDAFEQALNTSLTEKKGVVLYVNGQAIPGRVTKLEKDSVELSSREYARIVVRRERIDAVAGN